MSEFSRPLRVDAIGTEPREMTIEAGASELAALARRFEITSLGAVVAQTRVARRGGDFVASGLLRAEFVQVCVATGTELPAKLEVPFDVVFRSEPPSGVPDAGLELSASECDVTFYEGGEIDLGEAVAETLALAIDPYPRSPDADGALKDMGVLSEGEAGPFAALAALKK